MLDLKKRIEEETSIPIDQQLLLRHVYKFHELPDDTRVSDTVIVWSDAKQTMTINLLPRSQPTPVSTSNDVRTGYNQWAMSYDNNVNPTRDLEGKCLRKVLDTVCLQRPLRRILEIGCGTGKNSAYFLHEDFISRRSDNTEDEEVVKMKPFYHLGIDLSPEMLTRAQQQFPQGHFKLGDITLPWQQFLEDDEGADEGSFDLVAFSLVLEHIEDLNHIFEETAKVLSKGGLVYLGELHPIKQYLGSKARFEVSSTKNGDGEKTTVVLPCFVHHLTDFTQIAVKYGLQLLHIEECFDEGDVPNSIVDGKKIPRILSLLFVKH
jgi:SAM-dependent methyltransferase